MTRKEKIRQRLLHFAKRHLGKPYKYGASHWEAPKVFDCSSFSQYLFKRIGIALPRAALEQAHLGRRVDLKKPTVRTQEKLEIGDLIFFKGSIGRYDRKFPQGIGHVAVYIGDGKVISAYSESISPQGSWGKNQKKPQKGRVRTQSLKQILKRKDLVVLKRIF